MKTNIFILIVLTGLIIGCSPTSTLISFNIRHDYHTDKQNSWGNRKQEVIEFIKKYDPDIIGIQEGAKKTVSMLNKSLENYQFVGVGVDGKTKGEYTAIFYNTSKYKAIKDMTFWLSETPNIPSIGWDAEVIRICTYAAFVRKSSKDTVHVFNAHFDHKGRKAKEKSAELIIKKINELDLLQKNIVVMGDLNSRIKDKGIKKLNSMLDDGAKISKAPDIGAKGTFNFFNKDYKPSIQIDYIFTKNLKVLNYKHLNDKRKNGLWLSDHLPILIEIEH